MSYVKSDIYEICRTKDMRDRAGERCGRDAKSKNCGPCRIGTPIHKRVTERYRGSRVMEGDCESVRKEAARERGFSQAVAVVRGGPWRGDMERGMV